jgi:hypothetical protein
MTRKQISKRTRFEVFKRDSFTCQYCGKKAPEVILNCDHIKPVAKGGKNTILNLVTSCALCNSGKSDKLLSDDSAVSIAQRQAEEIQERRRQIEMMSEWYAGLNAIEDEQAEILARQLTRLSGFGLENKGATLAKALIKKHGLSLVIEHFQSAFSACEYGDPNSYGECFARAQTSLKWSLVPPAKQKARYLTGIIRNRCPKFWNWYPSFERVFVFALNIDISDYQGLYEIAVTAKDIRAARDAVLNYIEDQGVDGKQLYAEWNKE